MLNCISSDNKNQFSDLGFGYLLGLTLEVLWEEIGRELRGKREGSGREAEEMREGRRRGSGRDAEGKCARASILVAV